MIAEEQVFRTLLRKGWDPVIIADRLALGLAQARHRLVLPLAQAARRFVENRDWLSFGYARLEDHARERFGRSGRWLRDLNALADAIILYPSLKRAITGEDGGVPLGSVAALIIGRVATEETCAEWIGLARQLTVRELRKKSREERKAASGDAPRATRAGPQSDSPADPTSLAAEAPDDGSPGEDDLVTIRFAVPRAICAAIEEARELHRAVCGGETTTSEFIEALLAESAAGPVDRLPDEGWIGARLSPAERESALEQKGEKWSFLKVRLEGQELCEARQTLEEVARVFEDVEAVRGSPDSAIRTLIRLENEIELRLGDLLALMGESGAWKGLCFAGVGHYAEERLGISRSVGQCRSHLARVFRMHQGLRGACEAGRLGLEAATLVARILGGDGFDARHDGAWSLRRGEDGPGDAGTASSVAGASLCAADSAPPDVGAAPQDAGAARRDAGAAPRDAGAAPWGAGTATWGAGTVPWGVGTAPWEAGSTALSTAGARRPDAYSMGVKALESAWIEHAEESTLKRLREELRIVERDRSLGLGLCSQPIDDETWQRSRSRRAGQAREALALLTQAVLDASRAADTVIRFRLPLDLASSLLSVVREERRRLSEICRNDEVGPVTGDGLAVRAARLFSKRCSGVPEWCALFALIEDFVDTWDDPRQCPKRAADKIYVRDGWRCAAPGCTSRRNLEEHHIVYRSHGGDHSPSNRVTLCRFHHQQGEHLGLMKCRGKAPLGITWLMGRRGAGGVFRNERRVRARIVSEQPVLAAGAS